MSRYQRETRELRLQLEGLVIKTQSKRFGYIVILDALGQRQASIKEAEEFIAKRDELVRVLPEAFGLADFGGWMNSTPPSPTPLKTYSFGDTIEMTFRPPDAEIHWLAWLGQWLLPVIYWGLQRQLLFRGAVGCGEFIDDENSVIGPGVSDAASWYDESDWAGIVATPSVGQRLEFLRGSWEEMLGEKALPTYDRVWTRYEVPLSQSRSRKASRDQWCLCWPEHYVREYAVTEHHPRWWFLAHLQRFAIPPGCETKYSNTLSFFDWYLETRHKESFD